MIYIDGDALKTLRPGKQWVWRGNGYSGLEWLDSEYELDLTSVTWPTEPS